MIIPFSTQVQAGGSRGVFIGGYGSSGYETMEYINIQSTGNAEDFGDCSRCDLSAGCSSSTRGIAAGNDSGEWEHIIYITIATLGNSSYFGDMTDDRGRMRSGGASSETRGIFAGGYSKYYSAARNIIDYITIASTGNATDFGDLTAEFEWNSGGGSSTRAVFVFGAGKDGEFQDPTRTIEYVTIASTGNSTDFGDDITADTFGQTSCSNSTRMIIAQGFGLTSSDYRNEIRYITIASTGNQTDFGDCSIKGYRASSVVDSTRAVLNTQGTSSGSSLGNVTLEYVTIASTGNATDFGDTLSTSGAATAQAGVSDSHGGL